ncbi:MULTISPECIES: hypothetical protein [unclassified Pseudomonas]|uniref:hypothetical protein n=1 Tax=unclassified Pseudomonas TaxID=196821 RepID=UPI001CC0C382|nr:MULTISPECIES: hypothetical protein [unclassified Pseudomonas]
MSFSTKWLHGTTSTITEWTLDGRGAIKGPMPLHKALFFTSNRSFAEGSSGSSGSGANVYQTTIKAESNVLDLSKPGVTCTTQESEIFRKRVMMCRPGKTNIQAEYQQHWEAGWQTGAIMKYAHREHEEEQMKRMHYLAMYKRDTPEGIASYNHLQKTTRDCIEDIVDAAIAAGYQAVAGHELQSSVTYPLLIVLDPSILSAPVKV